MPSYLFTKQELMTGAMVDGVSGKRERYKSAWMELILSRRGFSSSGTGGTFSEDFEPE